MSSHWCERSHCYTLRHFKLRPLPLHFPSHSKAVMLQLVGPTEKHQCGSTRLAEKLLLGERVMERQREREQMGWQSLSPSPQTCTHTHSTHSHTTAASQAES